MWELRLSICRTILNACAVTDGVFSLLQEHRQVFLLRARPFMGFVICRFCHAPLLRAANQTFGIIPYKNGKLK